MHHGPSPSTRRRSADQDRAAGYGAVLALMPISRRSREAGSGSGVWGGLMGEKEIGTRARLSIECLASFLLCFLYFFFSCFVFGASTRRRTPRQWSAPPAAFARPRQVGPGAEGPCRFLIAALHKARLGVTVTLAKTDRRFSFREMIPIATMPRRPPLCFAFRLVALGGAHRLFVLRKEQGGRKRGCPRPGFGDSSCGRGSFFRSGGRGREAGGADREAGEPAARRVRGGGVAVPNRAAAQARDREPDACRARGQKWSGAAGSASAWRDRDIHCRLGG